MKFVPRNIDPIEAWQVGSTPRPKWVQNAFDNKLITRQVENELFVATRDGTVWAPHGSYVILGTDMSLTAMTQSRFEEQYKPAEED